MARLLKTEIGSLLSRRFTPLLSKQLQRPALGSRRSFSAAAEHEDAEEAVKWRNLTIAGFVLCTSLTVYNFTGGHEEEEHDERKEYSYLHIRNKEFPWGPDGLFEYHHES